MTERRKIIATLTSVILLSSFSHAADIKIDAVANRDSIYTGEPVILTVNVAGLDSPQVVPDLSAITNCTVKMLGSQSKSYSSFTWVNGKTTRSGFSGRIFTYELTPQSTGLFQAGPVTLKVDNSIYAANGPLIKVVGIEKQDWVEISIKSSRDAVLVDEPFDITFSIRLKRLTGKYADIEPLDPSDPPTLTVPFLENSPIQGLETPDIGRILNKHFINRSDAPGFAINSYSVGNNAINSIFDIGIPRQTKARFTFDKKTIDLKGISYFEYTLKMSYVPKEEASHTFGPVLFKGPIVTGVTQDGRGTKNTVFAVGPAVTVRIVPPPEENRPSSYIGAIGSNITAEAFIDTQTCKVGDPIRLTLAISGNARLENINPPPLNLQEKLTRNFRIYEDTVQASIKEGKKTFSFTIRPITAGTIEFPPIEVSYFDAASRSYKTVKTTPIPVRANESQEIGAANIIGSATNRSNATGNSAAQNFLIPAPVDFNPAGSKPDSLELKPWETAVLIGSPLLYCFFAGTGFARRRLRLGEDSRKRRRAVNESLSLLRDCIKASESSPAGVRTTLSVAIRKYLANRFGASEAGLTPSDSRKLLNVSAVDPAVAGCLCDILERNFNSAYSSSNTLNAANITEDCRQAYTLIRQIEDKLTRVSAAGKTEILTLLLCLSVTAISSADVYAAPSGSATTDSAPPVAGNPVELQFIWNEANSKMASASSPEDFLTAAGTYKRLIDAGVRNSHVFYNMGTALLKAGQYDTAITALLRAERYYGNNEDIRHNMLIAMCGRDKNPNASLPWYRVPLFWHYDFPLSSRIAIAVCAFGGIWLAIIMRSTGSSRIYKPLLYISFIVMAVFGTSAATSFQQEERDSQLYRENVLKFRQVPAQQTTNAITNSGSGIKP